MLDKDQWITLLVCFPVAVLLGVAWEKALEWFPGIW